jgi:hypothetical protein
MERIGRSGLETWLGEQRERRLLLEELLANYNEGRAMRFYCLACTVMPVALIREGLAEAKAMRLDGSDLEAKAKGLRSITHRLASKSGIELNLGR